MLWTRLRSLASTSSAIEPVTAKCRKPTNGGHFGLLADGHGICSEDGNLQSVVVPRSIGSRVVPTPSQRPVGGRCTSNGAHGRRRPKRFDVDAFATGTDPSSMALLVCGGTISRSMEVVGAGRSLVGASTRQPGA